MSIVFSWSNGSKLHAQNLLINGDFEYYNICDTNSIKQGSWNNIYATKFWKALNFRTGYANTNLSSYPNHYNFIKAHQGNGMAQIYFGERCPWYLTLPENQDKIGCTDYLIQKLHPALEFGEIYEVRYWLYIPTDDRQEENFAKSFGFCLGLEYPQFNGIECMLNNDFFPIDSIIYDRWFEVKKLIRAQCDLQYFILGLFRTEDFPKLYRGNSYPPEPFFLIDDISITRFDKHHSYLDSIDATPYCKYYKKQLRNQQFINQKTVLHYDLDSFNITKKHQLIIDEFLKQFKTLKNASIEIIGYTDNKGHDNKNLSNVRATTVSDYIIMRDSSTKDLILSYGMADQNPIGTNDLATGRQQNRRVEIKVSNLTHNQILYRNILREIELNHVDLAIRMYCYWITRVSMHDVSISRTDQRIAILKNQKYKAAIQRAILSKKLRVANKNLALTIDSLGVEDQKYRHYGLYNSIAGKIVELDTLISLVKDYTLDSLKVLVLQPLKK